ncbi:MAG: ABC transporter ATP-binding protein [Bacteroidales bacterium]|nr:ABC transporter ATP-binding protein [Bacteroidales bacterium]
MIEINNLAFSFRNHPVLQGISMRLEEGKIYGLLGENGVGKTTLLTLLCGLKRPQAGSILADGRAPFDRQPSLLQEQFYLPDEVMPIRANAAKFATERSIFWPKFSFITYEAVLREFEVDTTQRMDKMSAGQLKKTWIAFALACGARYYYMDEPTNGLDIPSKAQFRKALMKYTSEEATMVISTHQVRDLESIIDPIIVLDSKEVLVNATLEEISKKLYFDYGTQLHPGALYLEQTPGGAIQVYPNESGEESKVNLEAFFNAVYAHKDIARQLFSNK